MTDLRAKVLNELLIFIIYFQLLFLYSEYVFRTFPCPNKLDPFNLSHQTVANLSANTKVKTGRFSAKQSDSPLYMLILKELLFPVGE